MTHPYKRPDGLYNIPANINAVETFDNLFPRQGYATEWKPTDEEKRERIFVMLNEIMANESAKQRYEASLAIPNADSDERAAAAGLAALLGIDYTKTERTTPSDRAALASAQLAARFKARHAANAAVEHGDY